VPGVPPRRSAAASSRSVLGQPGQVGSGALERRECGPARLVRERDRHLAAAGKRLEQLPLGAGQVLEAVREDRAPVPGVELRGDALGGPPTLEVAVPGAEPVELGAVGAVQLPESALDVCRVDEPALELTDRVRQGVSEAGEARRGAEPVQRGGLGGPAKDERAHRVREDGPRLAAVASELLEQVVEGADPAPEQAAVTAQQLPLDALDVRPVGHDQERPARKRGRIALEQERHLARVGGSRDERQPHRPIVVRALDDP